MLGSSVHLKQKDLLVEKIIDPIIGSHTWTKTSMLYFISISMKSFICEFEKLVSVDLRTELRTGIRDHRNICAVKEM